MKTRILVVLLLILAVIQHKNFNQEMNKLENEIEKLEIKRELLLEEKNNLLKDTEDLENRIKELEDIKVFSMIATAYTDDYDSQGPWVGKTATGRKPQVGVVAVDPKVIPLGTELYVEGYGPAVAGDTGGAIKGNRIDLFFNTSRECYQFGRQKLRVRVVE